MLKVYLASWLVVVAAYDLGQLRIPNWLVGLGAIAALAALALFPAESFQPTGWAIAAGIAAAVVVLLPAYIFKVMGAADVKLGVALALWFSLQSLAVIWIVGTLLCGLHAAVLIGAPALKQRFAPWLAYGASPVDAPPRKRRIPYGAYLAIGALVNMAALS